MKVKITGKTGKKYVRLTLLVNTANGYQNKTRTVTAVARTIIRKRGNGAELVTSHCFPGAFVCFT